mmetsp:Transcript_8292/g.25061  ORF Transcript_8292/g.25061 Transcript_8292/m.25061 type:complete len:144 (+) Transcript_8292:136-567(+)
MAAGRGGDAAWSRMNCHDTTLVEQEVMGHIIRLSQNPASEHLGTTVWDASIVLAKYLEKNMRKGEFSRPRLKGKRVLELGAGMVGLLAISFGFNAPVSLPQCCCIRIPEPPASRAVHLSSASPGAWWDGIRTAGRKRGADRHG